MIKVIYTYKKETELMKGTKYTKVMYDREYIPFLRAMNTQINLVEVYENIHSEWLRRPMFWHPAV